MISLYALLRHPLLGQLILLSALFSASCRRPGDPTALLADAAKTFGSHFHIADGYDVLEGKYRSSCLDTGKTTIRSYPVHRAQDSLYIVYSKADLLEKLNLDINLQASGTKDLFTGGGSVRSSLVSETDFAGDSIVAIAEYRYVKDQVDVYDSVPQLSTKALGLLKSGDKLGFRRECGDEYTTSIKTGASLFLVFRAERASQTIRTAAEVETSLKVALGSIFGLNNESKITSEDQKIISDYRISSKCYSEGTSAHPCADHLLNLSSLTLGENVEEILKRIKGAKHDLANSVDTKDDLVTIDETRQAYEVPSSFGTIDRFSLFFDYGQNLATIKEWLEVEEQMLAVCNAIERTNPECSKARLLTSAGLENCAIQQNFQLGRCAAPKPNAFDDVLSLRNAGTIVLFEHGAESGRKLALAFDDVLSTTSKLQANVIYNLADPRFGSFDNIVSSLQADQLRQGWQLVLFEGPNATGQKMMIPAGSPYMDADLGFNDKASSFRLERATVSPAKATNSTRNLVSF